MTVWTEAEQIAREIIGSLSCLYVPEEQVQTVNVNVKHVVEVRTEESVLFTSGVEDLSVGRDLSVNSEFDFFEVISTDCRQEIRNLFASAIFIRLASEVFALFAT